MQVSNIVKLGTIAGGTIGGIISAWLFLTSYFALASEVQEMDISQSQEITLLRLEINEDKLYRLQESGVETTQEEAREKGLERRIRRLEKQLIGLGIVNDE